MNQITIPHARHQNIEMQAEVIRHPSENSDDLEIEIARAEALRDAEIAFEKLDVNGDGFIDREEAALLIVNQSNFSKDELTKQ